MAYTTGWAQRIINDTATHTLMVAANATIAIGASNPNNPVTTTPASSLAFEVTAGSQVTVRWGYSDLNNLFGENVATNTITADLRIFYENQSTNLWETTATDTFSTAGNATTPPNTLDRSFSFTPTHTGTLRIWVRVHGFVTASSTNINDMNSDGGTQFGGPAEAFTTGSAVSSTYGLYRSGTTLVSLGLSSATPVFYPTTETFTLMTGAAPRFADGTYSISYRSAPGAGNQFNSTTVPAGTTTTPSDGGLQCTPTTGSAQGVNAFAVGNSFPAAATNVSLGLTPSNSVLSTANGGAALPWIHFTAVPSSPGTVVSTNDATGNTVAIEFQGIGTFDPRLQVHCHSQKSTPIAVDAPNTPSFTDIILYIISADLFKGYVHIANNAASPANQSGMTANLHLSDPTFTSPTTLTASQGTGDNVATPNNTDNTGWTATNPSNNNVFAFTPSPPSGQWHYYCANATDGSNNTWSGSYIVRVESNPQGAGNFAGFEVVNFVSAYRDNLLASINHTVIGHTNKIPKPGNTLRIAISAWKTTTSVAGAPFPYHFDQGTVPNVRMTRWNSVTNALEYWTPIGAVPSVTDNGNQPMTTSYVIDGSGLPGLWTFDWIIPSTAPNDFYQVVLGSSMDGGDKYAFNTIIISSDLTNPVFDGVDFATGFPFR